MRRAPATVLVVLTIFVSACSGGTAILANPAAAGNAYWDNFERGAAMGRSIRDRQEQEALRLAAPFGAQPTQLLRGFDAFGGRHHAQTGPEPHHGAGGDGSRLVRRQEVTSAFMSIARLHQV